METLKASKTPWVDIEKIAYKGQDPKKKMYRAGYEDFFNSMPVLNRLDSLLKEKVKFSEITMNRLAQDLARSNWIKHLDPGPGNFQRTIVGMEAPLVDKTGQLKEGSEIIVASWGDGFSTPVHGHAAGYIHEELIEGKMLVNTYRRMGNTNIARPVLTEIKEPGTIVSMYAQPDFENLFERKTLIHNFKAIGFSTTLHYLPEHTRDGRDNGFKVERFEDVFDLSTHVRRIDSYKGMYLQKGDVALVRSQNVPEYGDHYIVITGHPIVKAHGLRPQDKAIGAPNNMILDKYESETGLILLKLDDVAKKAFHEFHDIWTLAGEIIFPTA